MNVFEKMLVQIHETDSICTSKMLFLWVLYLNK